MPDSKPKNKGGRPRKTLDYNILNSLCEIQCTGEEIANVLGMDYDTLNKALKREKGVGFTDYYKKHSANGKASLRRLQFRAAENGNSAVLIWLGKQYLGQQDKSVVENHNLNTEMPTIVVDDSVQDE